MAADMPVIPKAGSIFVHTGNIVNWNRLKKRLTQSPTQELTDCIGSTVGTWLQSADRTELQYATELECKNVKFIQQVQADERETLRITAKIYLTTIDPDAVPEAVHSVMKELDTSELETVLLSLPQAHHNLTDLLPLWRTLEGLVNSKEVFSLGVSDFSKDLLEELYEEAVEKPCINQVNMETCCVMPPELTQFAKGHDIQLLTHNDPKELLPAKPFQDVMGKTLTEKDGRHWQPYWIARYSVIISCRGIIKQKGYIVRGIRDINKRD